MSQDKESGHRGSSLTKHSAEWPPLLIPLDTSLRVQFGVRTWGGRGPHRNATPTDPQVVSQAREGVCGSGTS